MGNSARYTVSRTLITVSDTQHLDLSPNRIIHLRLLKEIKSKQQKPKGLLKIMKYGSQGFQTYSEVPVLEDPKARKNPNKTGTSNPTQNFAAKICMGLSNRKTPVLYMTV